jgi:hypothetical protein
VRIPGLAAAGGCFDPRVRRNSLAAAIVLGALGLLVLALFARTLRDR